MISTVCLFPPVLFPPVRCGCLQKLDLTIYSFSSLLKAGPVAGSTGTIFLYLLVEYFQSAGSR